MFTERMPLLAQRTVLITVAREDEKTIRAHVIPKRIKEDENAALTTPLSFVGTPEELDRDFARELAGYVDAHQRLGSTLAEAKATMEAAAKASQEEAKRKTEEKRKSKMPSSTPASTPSEQPTAGSVSADAPKPGTAGLFGTTESVQPQQQGGLRL